MGGRLKPGHTRVYNGSSRTLYSPLSISARDDRLISARLEAALRHPYSKDAVLLGIETARALLSRVEALLPSDDEELRDE